MAMPASFFPSLMNFALPNCLVPFFFLWPLLVVSIDLPNREFSMDPSLVL